MSFEFYYMLPSEEIKEKINIVDLIGEYIPLKKAGVNFRAPCPFHKEKTPSFIVSPAKQIWHCFGCGLGGDIFEYIKQIEGVEFPEALEILARRSGVVLKRPAASYQAQTDQKKPLLEINELAAKYFAKVLSDSTIAKPAREYLVRRGLKPETVQKWRIGFAPDDFHSFENFIAKKGYQRREALAAGLLSEKSDARGGDGQFFDRFRDRIMFPICDIHGRVVGFTGRVLAETNDAAKYVNSPETLVYSKSHLIYGLNHAKTEIRQKNEVIVVEGQVDVITCHEFGFANVVASSGTALTLAQLEMLKRFTDNISFAFDVDDAGLTATRRAVELALSLGFNVKIIAIPKAIAKDPDELLRRDPRLWQERVNDAKGFLDFYFDSVFAKIDLQSNIGKKQAVSELLPLISLLPDPIDRSHYVNLLANRVGADQKIIFDLLNNKLSAAKNRGYQDPDAPRSSAPVRKSKLEMLERRVMGLYLRFAKNLQGEWGELKEDDFSTPLLQEIFTATAPLVKGENFSVSQAALQFPKFAGELELLAFAVENELSTIADWKLDEVQKQFLGSLRLENVKRQMTTLTSRIKQAENLGHWQEVKDLSGEFNNLSKELAKYHIQ
ncbi:DNA primase [bacterium]|nr:MAG: DNA primase [bacterium]